ncbi:hypothetical protein ES703_99854 [subsurface metagenome]
MYAFERNIRPLQITTHKRPIENCFITHFQTHIVHLCVITAVGKFTHLFVDCGRIGDNYTRGVNRNLRQVEFTACQGDILNGKFIFCQLSQLCRPDINRNPSSGIVISHHRIYCKCLFFLEIVVYLIGPGRPHALGHHHVAGHINRFHRPFAQNIFRFRFLFCLLKPLS